ncbi:MAG: hypothetical protein B1H11_11125 [Desulfobacteraceae bacterium 4484_190.1]|nr:MAG: hypothetical protein B1H11_11125 [Desulfobacteraceae bacterium 4484_190.1]
MEYRIKMVQANGVGGGGGCWSRLIRIVNMKDYLKILWVLMVIFSACKKEKETPVVKFGSLTGKVVNEYDQPIEGVVLELDTKPPKTSETDPSGSYLFNRIPVGSYKLSVSKKAFITQIRDVDILEEETLVLDLKLASGNSYLEISDSLLKMTSSDNTIDVQVSSNAAWTVKESSDWITVSSESGQGNSEVSVKILENSGDTVRVDTVIFSCGEITRLLVINQDFPIRLLRWEGVIGDRKTDMPDSAYLLFNKPVTVMKVVSDNSYCNKEIDFQQVNDRKGVAVSFTCAVLGGEYPLNILVYDVRGQRFQKQIWIHFYDDRLDVEGTINCYHILDDKNMAWISTYSPNRLIKISLDDFQILKTIELESSPTYFVVNPYNDLLYVLLGDNKIHVYNQYTGSNVKNIVFKPEADDHPQYPTIYPYNIGFTKSGYGIVLLCEDGASGVDWKVIDSAKGDTTYRHKDRGNGPGEYSSFKRVYLNYDHSKLLLTEKYGSCTIVILDGTTHEFEDLVPSSLTRGVFITPNRKNSKIYAGQLYDQFIIDMDGTLSGITYIDNRFGGSADFSYREGEKDIIYFCDQYYFRLIDYGNYDIPLWCYVLPDLRDFKTSIDGNYAFFYKLTYPGSYFYKFDTKAFALSRFSEN